VRPLQVGDHQAQEGRGRRPAQLGVRQADQEHRGRGPPGRRRPGRQPDPLRRHPEGEEDLGAQRQHRPRRQARLRGRDRRRRLPDDHVRGLRPARGRGARRVPHRQPQPGGGRRPHRLHPQRRRDGRPGQRGLPVLPQGPGARAEGGHQRGRRAGRRARRRRRGGQRPRRRLRGDQRGHRPGAGADGAAGRRHRVRLRRGLLRPLHAGAAGRRRRGCRAPPHRGAGGQRRRAERLRQPRGPGRGPQPGRL
ncbi:MAG: Probable transcriptional regulatory protein YebC, partial [uncultured Quadrisphaera sp.]